ncbi:MAG: M12 family metallo-peptidase [Candidatus Kapaibacteriota bacterium]
MKRIISGIVIVICIMQSIALSAKTIDAGLGITFLSSNSISTEMDNHARQMIIESVWAEITFAESGSSFTIENFPISLQDKGNITLNLVPSSVDGTTEFYIGDRRFPLPNVRTFSGHIINEPQSSILLTHARGEISGWVERADGSRIIIAPIDDDNLASHHVLYDEHFQNQLRNTAGSCMTDESSITIPTPEDLYSYMGKVENNLGNNLLELQVVVEGTTAFFNGPGRKDSMRTAEFMIGLMNGVNSLYRKELNIAIIIPRLQIWTITTPDPYVNDGNAPALLGEVESRWSKITTVKRDIVHCLDAVPTQGGLFVLGIANGIGNVCSGGVSNAYSVAGIFKNGLSKITDYVGDIVTIAHELGHNIGSYHTHNCSFWPPSGLDSCMTSGSSFRGRSNYSTEACFKGSPLPNPGSIMSYCHLTNPSRSVAFTFLPRVSTFLRTYLESKPCIEAATLPTIRMIYPWGQQSFVVGEQMNIEWTSHRVNNVNIEFSTDGGETWRAIFVSRPAVTETAGTGLFKWTIPDNPTTKGRIRLVDANNSQIRDTSWADFTIARSSLTITTDLRSKSFGQKERINLAWSKEFIDKIDIEFSSNGGANWSLIFDSTTFSAMTVDIPDIESNNCYFRVRDINKKLVSQTGPFTVGKETISMIEPKSNDTICIGKSDTVRWTSEFMSNSKIFLEYRPIGQTAWRRISSLGHDAELGKHAWVPNPPNITEGIYQFRASYRLDTSIATLPVTIAITSQGECATIVGVVDENILSIYPNPAKDMIFVQHVPMNCETPSVFITDTRGKTIMQNTQLSSSNHSIEVSIKSYPNGQYFMNIICGSSTYSAPFSINR